MRFTPTTKISELEALTSATLDTTFVVGISGSTTYKISINQLTSSLDGAFATDLVTTALSNSLDTKLATTIFNTNSSSFHSRINAVSSSVSMGTSGTSGVNGTSGNNGTSGTSAVGSSGTTGTSGLSGTSGTSGTNGVQGPQGINGTAGSSGVQGSQGNQGPIGPQGNQGNQGPAGSNGSNGAQGNQGTTGPQGNQGNQGPTGTQGFQGTQGTQGTQGNQGTTGPQGVQGTNGTSGTSGVSIDSGSFATTSSLSIVSASAWGAFQSASSYSGSLQTTITTLSSSVDSRLDTLEASIITGSANYTQVLGNRRTGITSVGTSIISGSITTSGNPVQIMVTGDANPQYGTAWARLQIYRDGNAIGGIVQVENSSNLNVPYCVNVIDTPSAGTYVYSMRLVDAMSGTFDFGEASGPLLTAVELNSKTSFPSGTISGSAQITAFGFVSSSVPAWTSAGAITLTATTTSPTKGTTTSDNISYRQLGAKEWEVVMTYIQSATNGTSGTGDYLITLPNGLSFDTTLPSQPIYTANVGASTFAHFPYVIPNGNGTITNHVVGGQLFPMVYSATKFRILTLTYGSGIQCWSSGFYSTIDVPKIQLTFRFTST